MTAYTMRPPYPGVVCTCGVAGLVTAGEGRLEIAGLPALFALDADGVDAPLFMSQDGIFFSPPPTDRGSGSGKGAASSSSDSSSEHEFATVSGCGASFSICVRECRGPCRTGAALSSSLSLILADS